MSRSELIDIWHPSQAANQKPEDAYLDNTAGLSFMMVLTMTFKALGEEEERVSGLA